MSRSAKYPTLIKQAESLISGESNLIANLANISALLHEELSFFWVGFYFCEEDEMVLGPFQGPVACTRIPKSKGVCGASWREEKSIIVDNVHEFPGHIACSSLSNSEIVVPVFDKNGKVALILDVDSREFNEFDTIDQENLEKIASLLTSFL